MTRQEGNNEENSLHATLVTWCLMQNNIWWPAYPLNHGVPNTAMIPNSNQHLWVYQFGTHECHEVDSSSLMPWKGDMHFSFAHAQLSLATVSADCLATFGCAIREAEDFINVYIALQKEQSKTENSFLNPRSSQTFCRLDSGPSCADNTNMAKNKLFKASRTTSLQGTERVDQSFVTLETSRQPLAGRNDLSNRVYEYISELEYVKRNALNKASKESLQHFCLTTYSFLGGFGEVVKRSDTSPRVFASTHHAIIVGVVSLVLSTALGECNTPTTNEMGVFVAIVDHFRTAIAGILNIHSTEHVNHHCSDFLRCLSQARGRLSEGVEWAVKWTQDAFAETGYLSFPPSEYRCRPFLVRTSPHLPIVSLELNHLQKCLETYEATTKQKISVLPRDTSNVRFGSWSSTGPVVLPPLPANNYVRSPRSIWSAPWTSNSSPTFIAQTKEKHSSSQFHSNRSIISVSPPNGSALTKTVYSSISPQVVSRPNNIAYWLTMPRGQPNI